MRNLRLARPPNMQTTQVLLTPRQRFVHVWTAKRFVAFLWGWHSNEYRGSPLGLNVIRYADWCQSDECFLHLLERFHLPDNAIWPQLLPERLIFRLRLQPLDVPPPSAGEPTESVMQHEVTPCQIMALHNVTGFKGVSYQYMKEGVHR